MLDTPVAERVVRHALLEGTFVLRSGATSSYYFDKFRVVTNPELLAAVARAATAELDQLGDAAELIICPELGAVPLATAISLESGIPFVIVRSAAKAYGTQRAIEGEFQRGVRAVLVEDVVTSGGAACAAVSAARESGIDVFASICLLDRGEGGAEALARAGAPLRSLIDPGLLRAATTSA